MSARTETYLVVDVALGGNATLRCSLVEGALVLASGFDAGENFRRPHWADGPIRIPASALADLLRGLGELATVDAQQPGGRDAPHS